MTDAIDELDRLLEAVTKAQTDDPDYEPGLESSTTVSVERAAYAMYRAPKLTEAQREALRWLPERGERVVLRDSASAREPDASTYADLARRVCNADEKRGDAWKRLLTVVDCFRAEDAGRAALRGDK